MKDSTKQFLIIFLPCFLSGFFMGVFGNYLRPEFYLLSILALVIIMVFLSKKFTSKTLKNDEIIKKVAITSDAVSARSALVVIFIYILLDFTGFIEVLPPLQTREWFLILFLAMTIPALIASIYYSNNPDKLP